jgi:septum site-determining protein MinC
MEQETRGIVFKGNSEGLVIVVPEEYGFEQALEEIDNKVSNAARFFKGARIKVTYRGANWTSQQEERVKSVLDEKSGAVIESFTKDEESRQSPAVPKQHQPAQPVSTRRLFFAGVDEGNCKFVRSTVRSGTRIQYDGNVVIMGDVNPGGEIIASGNVVVLGVLRGMVHAGADGNRDAFIYALSIRPTQIRIAEVIARMPEEAEDTHLRPEIATIRNDRIEVEPLSTRALG